MSDTHHIRRRSPARCGSRPAAAAVLLSSLFLSGCATFSPDAGMGVVAGVAGGTIQKDVISIKTQDDALRADSAVKALLRRTLTVD
ncbi:MAG: TolC family protein, partial [Comamonadaceae bacterium]